MRSAGIAVPTEFTLAFGPIEMMTIESPEVSVIVPAYQAAVYIPDLCLSLQAQSFQNFEVLIADDGSPDDIRAAVTPFLSDNIVS